MKIVCEECGKNFDTNTMQTSCDRCEGLLEVVHDVSGAQPDLMRTFDARAERIGSTARATERSGVWRFRELVLPAEEGAIVSHPEGNTPLIVRERIAGYAGVRSLLLKHEGHNPTASFKDRGMTVAVTQAKRIGASAVACASTGNTSASLSAYAAQAGLPSFVFVPDGQIAAGKLAQTAAYGAHVLRIAGDFDECLRLARSASSELGIYLVNSVNPFRIEGQKTIVFELLQQLGWQQPDWISLPAGNLGNTSAFGKAIREALDCGFITKAPRLLAVQAEGASPFAQSFANHFAQRVRMHAETRATAIRIGDPASWSRAVRAIESTNGSVVSVSDDEIFAAKAVIDGNGVGCEPASAASVAGVRALVQRGEISPHERVVCILTGHLLKDPGGDKSLSDHSPALDHDGALREINRVLEATLAQ